eukprot:COSAG02_NODE_2296_length_9197_cov_11.568587_9_plen_117_part_00
MRMLCILSMLTTGARRAGVLPGGCRRVSRCSVPTWFAVGGWRLAAGGRGAGATAATAAVRYLAQAPCRAAQEGRRVAGWKLGRQARQPRKTVPRYVRKRERETESERERRRKRRRR